MLLQLSFSIPCASCSAGEAHNYDPGRTRTCNPRLCRPMPYPLGHGAAAAASTSSRPAPRHTMCSACAAPGWHADTTNAHLPPTGGSSSGYPDLHRSHYCSRYTLGCCSHASLFVYPSDGKTDTHIHNTDFISTGHPRIGRGHAKCSMPDPLTEA